MNKLIRKTSLVRGGRYSRIELRRSHIHGRGCFARKHILKNEPLIQYTGEYIDGNEALERDRSTHPHYSEYIMEVHDDLYVDGQRGGNVARFINHSCAPNARIEIRGTRPFLMAARPIRAGEEITFDYEYNDPDRYPCFCRAATCRGHI